MKEILKKLLRPILLSCIAVTAILGCKSSPPTATNAGFVPVSIHFHTAEGAPVVGGAVQVAQEIWESEATGMIHLQLPATIQSQRIRATCPATHWTSEQERVLSPMFLRSKKKLAFDVVCEPRHKYLALAVYSECERVEIEADGQLLGVTAHGVLYAQYGQPKAKRQIGEGASAVQITGRSLDPKCLLLDSEKKRGSERVKLTLDLEKDTQAVWASLSKFTPPHARARRLAKPRPLRL